MKITRNSIFVKLLVYMLTILGATATMLYFKGSILGLGLSVLVLICGFFIYAFALNKKS